MQARMWLVMQDVMRPVLQNRMSHIERRTSTIARRMSRFQRTPVSHRNSNANQVPTHQVDQTVTFPVAPQIQQPPHNSANPLNSAVEGHIPETTCDIWVLHSHTHFHHLEHHLHSLLEYLPHSLQSHPPTSTALICLRKSPHPNRALRDLSGRCMRAVQRMHTSEIMRLCSTSAVAKRSTRT
jgi:hypothetical protein